MSGSSAARASSVVMALSTACISDPMPSASIASAISRRRPVRACAGAAAAARRADCNRRSSASVGSEGRSKRRLAVAAAVIARIWLSGADSDNARFAPAPSKKPSGCGRSTSASVSGCTATPCQVASRANSGLRRSTGTPWPPTPWPKPRWVPINRVAPVSGSGTATTLPGAVARKCKRPSRASARIGGAVAGASSASMATVQPESARDRRICRSAGSTRRSIVASGNRVMLASPNTGSARSADRSTGRRSSNTTRPASPRRSAAAPVAAPNGNVIAASGTGAAGSTLTSVAERPSGASGAASTGASGTAVGDGVTGVIAAGATGVIAAGTAAGAGVVSRARWRESAD